MITRDQNEAAGIKNPVFMLWVFQDEKRMQFSVKSLAENNGVTTSGLLNARSRAVKSGAKDFIYHGVQYWFDEYDMPAIIRSKKPPVSMRKGTPSGRPLLLRSGYATHRLG